MPYAGTLTYLRLTRQMAEQDARVRASHVASETASDPDTHLTPSSDLLPYASENTLEEMDSSLEIQMHNATLLADNAAAARATALAALAGLKEAIELLENMRYAANSLVVYHPNRISVQILLDSCKAGLRRVAKKTKDAAGNTLLDGSLSRSGLTYLVADPALPGSLVSLVLPSILPEDLANGVGRVVDMDLTNKSEPDKEDAIRLLDYTISLLTSYVERTKAILAHIEAAAETLARAQKTFQDSLDRVAKAKERAELAAMPSLPKEVVEVLFAEKDETPRSFSAYL